MKVIWAPWRLEYILSSKKKKPGAKKCLFCRILKESPGKKSLILFKSPLAGVLMNKYPYTNGHLMVVPLRHQGNFENLTAEEHAEMGKLLARSIRVLKKVYRPQGFNLGMNLGKVAGTGILGHVHYHVVPRWLGDHNFMPVLNDVRVMVEHLASTYQKLSGEFDAMSLRT